MIRKTMSTTNHELQLANDFVQHTDCNIFLTGKAGTGKTTFLHNLHKNTVKRMIITAPTGVAAINAGGVTLHSFFQLPFGGVQLLVIGDLHQLSPVAKQDEWRLLQQHYESVYFFTQRTFNLNVALNNSNSP